MTFRVVITTSLRLHSRPAGTVVLNFRTRFISHAGHHARFTRLQFRMLSAILIAGGHMSNEDVYDAMWGDDPDGGPLGQRENLGVQAHLCTARLERLGLHTFGSGRAREVALLGAKRSRFAEPDGMRRPNHHRAAA